MSAAASLAKVHWFSTQRMTVAVEVKDGMIIWAPPIIQKFVGQPIGNLERWLEKQGEVRAAIL